MTILQQFLNLFKDPRKRIKDAVLITQWLKHAIDSKTVFALVDIFPGDKDNKWRDKKSRELSEVLKYLGLIDNLIFTSEDTAIKLKGYNRPQYFRAIAGELAHRDLNIGYDSAEAQTQFIYKTDKEFQK